MPCPPHYDGLAIASSNPTKIAEYTRLSRGNIPVISGEDLREIMGTPDEIALYKAIEAGEGIIVEDSILVVDSVPVIDIKWKLPDLMERAKHETAELVWEVRLAYLKAGEVRVYKGSLLGHLRPWDVAGPGYDPIFNVDGVGHSLARLENRGLKDHYSARARAFKCLLANEPHLVVSRSDLPDWSGAFQNE